MTTLLPTTRNSDLAHDFAGVDGVLAVGKLAEAEALDLLGKHLGRDVSGDDDALALVKQCYCLAIAVRAVAAMVNRGSSRVPKGDLAAAVAYLKEAEERFKQKMPPNAPHYYSEMTLFHIFETTLQTLSEELQTRCMQLGIFPEDERSRTRCCGSCGAWTRRTPSTSSRSGSWWRWTRREDGVAARPALRLPARPRQELVAGVVPPRGCVVRGERDHLRPPVS